MNFKLKHFKTCKLCDAQTDTIPSSAKIKQNGDALDGAYWNCATPSCGGSFWVPPSEFVEADLVFEKEAA